LLKRLKRLHRVAKEQNCFLVEGTHAISEAIACGWSVETICCTEAWFGRHHRMLSENVGACYMVPESWLAQAVTTEHPDGVAGIVGVDASAIGDFSFDSAAFLGVATDAVQDPGNVGTLLRSIVAVGGDGLFLSGDSVHPMQPKLLRSTAGQWFRRPPRRVDLSRMIDSAKGAKVQVLVASMEGESYWKADLTKPTLLVVGNEGGGVRREFIAKADREISIPMVRGVESLNVAMAGTLILYEAYRQRSLNVVR
jgi:TrmH family RNA methyltransferase